MEVDIYTVAGIAGAAMVLGIYLANQAGWLESTDWRYPAINASGSALILVSLYSHWNLPSAIIQISWIIISAFGIARGLIKAKG